ncbi:E3 ubiquitin-protein ligase APD2 isoform X2 [Diospyros lotus]|uniref:E3 ubiquitin-protein ligase APD2 isoform X2 n=1 Tax=Diospyros lotus TaxID=55363 RepID=UPI0022541FAE|nr:E3 ubiquitin-protein ligase APD2 isoform X2 [Diospyros lotus]
MDAPDWTSQVHAAAASTSWSSSFARREFSGDAAASSSSSPVEEEAVPEVRNQHQSVEGQASVSNHIHYTGTVEGETSVLVREDTWSCIVVILTFWFFVSMTFIFGVYGSENLQFGPNSSLLIKPNPIFVDYIKLKQSGEGNVGPILYGLYKDPPLDVVTTWSSILNISVLAGIHKEWVYMLNKGSQINISYSVSSSRPSSLILIIAQGSEGFAQWLEDPSYPNTTLFWKVIHGSGTIQQDISKSLTYYVAVGNLNSEEVEVQLDIRVKALLYNTTEAYYNCAVADGGCSLKMFFPNGNAAVLTSPSSEQVPTGYLCNVKLSYGPRWITYLFGIGVMTLLMLLGFHFLNNFQCSRYDQTRFQFGDIRQERTPLLSQKDDDLSSWDSSYDSVTEDDEDLEDRLASSSLEGKPLKDGDYNNNIRRLCAICFDAPRDCFFLPCGHCVACFACGTRLS